MNGSGKAYNSRSKFYLNKWYLDFIGKNGEVMIFYAAELIWHGIKIPYTNWLHRNYSGEIKQKSRFHHVHFPERKNKLVVWNDKYFGIHGRWKESAEAVQAQIFESEEGELHWHCYQPSSATNLQIDGKTLEGSGYVEQLVLTIPAWKIPMEELRWGHVISEKYKMVWIELKGENTKQWLWLNGELIINCTIQNDLIFIPEKNIQIHFDRSTLLESEKKITSLADKLGRFIPGINKLVPINFLLADEFKWLSKVTIRVRNEIVDSGFSIHEFVNFKPPKN